MIPIRKGEKSFFGFALSSADISRISQGLPIIFPSSDTGLEADIIIQNADSKEEMYRQLKDTGAIFKRVFKNFGGETDADFS